MVSGFSAMTEFQLSQFSVSSKLPIVLIVSLLCPDFSRLYLNLLSSYELTTSQESSTDRQFRPRFEPSTCYNTSGLLFLAQSNHRISSSPIQSLVSSLNGILWKSPLGHFFAEATQLFCDRFNLTELPCPCGCSWLCMSMFSDFLALMRHTCNKKSCSKKLQSMGQYNSQQSLSFS